MAAFLFGLLAEGFEPARVRSRGNAKRFPAQHARREAPQRKRAAKPHADIPHRPPLVLIGSQQREPFFFGPSAWDSNPPGCGAEETRSVFQRSTRGAKRRSESGRRQPHADIPHRPPQNCLASSDGGLSFLHTAHPDHGKSIAKRAPVRPIVRQTARDGLEPAPNCYA